MPRERMLDGPGRLRAKGASRASSSLPTADLDAAQAGRARGAVAPRQRRQPAMLLGSISHRAQPLADLGGARLARRPAARRRRCRERSARLSEAEQILRARLNFAGHDAGLLHRARGRVCGG
ncbi:MAG: hypothetical protein MZV65_37460 [Chromatiales bacterium]|nr:hypothetical protein [Chromatiales bacterium]